MNLVASLFNIAGPDLIIILLIVLLLFGARKLPDIARGLGHAVHDLTKPEEELDGERTRPQIGHSAPVWSVRRMCLFSPLTSL